MQLTSSLHSFLVIPLPPSTLDFLLACWRENCTVPSATPRELLSFGKRLVGLLLLSPSSINSSGDLWSQDFIKIRVAVLARTCSFSSPAPLWWRRKPNQNWYVDKDQKHPRLSSANIVPAVTRRGFSNRHQQPSSHLQDSTKFLNSTRTSLFSSEKRSSVSWDVFEKWWLAIFSSSLWKSLLVCPLVYLKSCCCSVTSFFLSFSCDCL